MPGSFHGYFARAQQLPMMSPAAGTMLRSTNRGLPNTQAPDGRPIAGRPSEQIAALGLARTFQDIQLFYDMTVLENVALGGYLRSSSGTARAHSRNRSMSHV